MKSPEISGSAPEQREQKEQEKNERREKIQMGSVHEIDPFDPNATLRIAIGHRRGTHVQVGNYLPQGRDDANIVFYDQGEEYGKKSYNRLRVFVVPKNKRYFYLLPGELPQPSDAIDWEIKSLPAVYWGENLLDALTEVIKTVATEKSGESDQVKFVYTGHYSTVKGRMSREASAKQGPFAIEKEERLGPGDPARGGPNTIVSETGIMDPRQAAEEILKQFPNNPQRAFEEATHAVGV